jgi:hypothetical protein
MRPPKEHRGVAICLLRGHSAAMRWTILLLVAAVGCGGAETKGAKSHDEGADPEKAQLLVNEAKNKIESESFDEARELLREANRFSDATVRHKIKLATQAIDGAESAKLGKQVLALSSKGKCEEGLELAAKSMEGKQETEVPSKLKQATGAEHLECVDGVLEDGELARARKIQLASHTKSAMDPSHFSKLSDAVDKAVMDTLKKRATDAMEARDWPKVSAIFHDAVKKGEAGADDRETLLADVRKGIAKDVAKLVKASFGEAAGAKEALKKVDTLLAAGFWKPRARAAAAGQQVDDEAARLQKLLKGDKKGNGDAKKDDGGGATKLMPKKLARQRSELAFWVGCSAITCKEAGPTEMWAYGHAPLYPSHNPNGSAEGKLKHGRKAWMIAQGGGMALIAARKPGKLGSLKARAHAGIGWVKTSGLKSQSTAEFLPPGDAIVGSRVWGPLHKDAKEYELGDAIGMEGAKVQVQRLSDRGIITLARAQLHYGVTTKGMKVLAMCGNSLSEAVIDAVSEPKHKSLGDPRVTVSCKKGGKGREDPMGAIRIKRAWLPPRR